MKMALERVLQSQGFGTRKACRALIRRGAVSLGGETSPSLDPFAVVETHGLRFRIDGQTWPFRAQVYIALHKPAGSECSRSPSHHSSVFELLPAQFAARGVQPVGRLDQDSTGLLLLSDDGAFIHAHTSPRRRVAKTYVATVADDVTPQLIAALTAGVKLRGESDAIAARQSRMLDARRLEIVLEQGKYHQVKRMLAAAGTRCVALHRSAIGALTLDDLDLQPGAWRDLDDAQRARLAPTP